MTAAPVRERSAADAAVSRGVQVAVAAYLIWGFLTIYWKQLGAFAAVELIGWRMFTAAIVMAIITTLRHRWPVLLAALRDRPTVVRLFGAALLLGMNWVSYVWAVVNDRVVETALGYFISPLLTGAMGVLLLGERPSRAQQVAFGCALVSVAVLTVSYGRPPWIALLLAGTWSLYALSKRNLSLGAVDGLAGETFVLFVPSLLIVAFMSTRADSVVQSAGPVEWGFVLGTGLITAIPLMLFASAATSIPFTLLGPLNLLVPVINFGLGWLLFDEPMPADRLVGFAFVWVALFIVMGDRIRSARRTSIGDPVPVT